MQMYPHEAWDLIELFDLPGWWAESAGKFERYFKELSIDWPSRQWNFLAHMVSDHFSDPQTTANEQVDRSLIDELDKHRQRRLFLKGVGTKRVVIRDKLCRKVGTEVQADKQWQQAVGADRHLAALATAWLYTNNPMRDLRVPQHESHVAGLPRGRPLAGDSDDSRPGGRRPAGHDVRP